MKHSSYLLVAQKTITFEQAKTPEVIHALAKAVRTVHTIPKPPLPLTKLYDAVQDDYEELKELGFIGDQEKTLMEQVERLFQEHRAKNYPLAMLHGDLHPKNIFLAKGGKILLIDWEGSIYDDPFFDLVYSSACLNYTPEQEEEYLMAYLGRPLTPDEEYHFDLCNQIAYLACYFELLEFAYSVNNYQPITTHDPIHPWSWYMERFTESTGPLSPDFLYNWAQSIRKPNRSLLRVFLFCTAGICSTASLCSFDTTLYGVFGPFDRISHTAVISSNLIYHVRG